MKKGIFEHKISVAKIDAHREQLARRIRGARRRLGLISVLIIGFMLGMMPVLAAQSSDEFLVVGVIVGAVGVFLFGFYFLDRRRRQRDIARRRVEPLRQILGSLRDELLPTRKLELRYDLRDPDDREKMTWTETSDFGHAKIRYYDAWLRIQGVLADGTRFRIRMANELKTKKGRVLHEKRWLNLKVGPPESRYSIDQAAEHFHLLVSAFDNEAALHASPVVLQIAIDQLRGAIVIKARREDMDFPPEAVLGLLRGTVNFVIEHGNEPAEGEERMGFF
ncbi:hypothetical protein [Haliangium ochraceum]|uniref:Uncharacterized protein n=1 Tax=Haliangium ochraceum (strain DSM 14365 / JCM 11303 / SMP-2) TaxID=502025 RepID=D0LQH0_HALO1|nr:hypothetical protein [Haliangium ochraceum]ACY18979.1 hypothetical protein Hoch_6510 [Haliangium ochraceum DSM 14365]